MRRKLLLVVVLLVGFAGAARHDIWTIAGYPTETAYGWWALVPAIGVLNHGDTTELSIPGRCWIDSAGVRVYEDTATYPGRLPPSGLGWIDFPEWHRAPWYCTYEATFVSEHPLDQDRSNDTLRTTIVQMLGEIADTVICDGPVRGLVDGDIVPWELPRIHDISDSAGRAGPKRPLGSCLFLCGFDMETVYVSVNVLALDTREDGDRLVLKLDENGDGLWAGDSSEGTYTAFVNGGLDSVVCSCMPGVQSPGARSASSTASGNLHLEVAIPVGIERTDITVPIPGSWESRAAISFWRGDSCYGWWPGRLEMENWEDPACYGVFEWLIMSVQEDASDDVRVGRRVSTILPGNGLLPSGGRILDIQGRDVTREKAMLSPGIYFLRQEADNSTRKVIVQH